MPQFDDDVERAAKVWGDTALQREQCSMMGWMDSPLVLEHYVQPRITGDSKTNWLMAAVKNLSIPPGSSWLSLGCGAGGQEIFASRMNLFKTMVAYDASHDAIRLAREHAAKEGLANVDFAVENIGKVRLPQETYDVVLMTMALHHVKNLEHLLEQVAHTLKPNGYLVTNEYIGPSQFQFSDFQVELVRRLLACLPDHLKFDCVAKATKHEYCRHSRDWWNQVDPSEAIRSDEIPELVGRYLPVIRRIDYGGPILHLLLEFIVANFAPESEKDVAIIKLLGLFEETLIDCGVLKSDFAVIVAQKQDRGKRSLWLNWKRMAARTTRFITRI